MDTGLFQISSDGADLLKEARREGFDEEPLKGYCTQAGMATQPDAAVAASPPSSLCDKLIIRVWLNLTASL